MISRGVTLCGFAWIAACGSPAPEARTLAPEDLRAEVQAFEAEENAVFRDLAAVDGRFALRAGMRDREGGQDAAMAAVLAGDRTLGVVGKAVDPFSFEARARVLGTLKARLEAKKRRLPTEWQSATTRPALEQELLVRLVDEELERVAEERQLPASASELVRAVVATWDPSVPAAEIPARDRWLARRLGELRASIAADSFEVVRLRELDDTLDALEHAIDVPGYTTSTAALVALRETLESQSSRGKPGAPAAWPKVATSLRAHLGVAVTVEALDAAFERAEKELKARIERLAASAHTPSASVAPQAAALLFRNATCVDAVPDSRVRSLLAPPERNPACELRHALAAAENDAARVTAYVMLADAIGVARCALDVLRGKASADAATARFPATALSPEITAHWERLAVARPVVALGAGLAAAFLLESEDPEATARKWMKLGDAPYDWVRSELSSRRPLALR